MIGRKSQAALEFIMTYGWAILVVLVAIGALAYFGVLSPDKFLPSKCLLQSGIACLEHKATPTDIQVVLQNSLGDDLTAVSVTIPGCNPVETTVGTGTLANGEKSPSVLITCTPPGLTGSKFSGAMYVNYTSSNNIRHANTGQLTARIE